jgi:hypothetical protein
VETMLERFVDMNLEMHKTGSLSASIGKDELLKLVAQVLLFSSNLCYMQKMMSNRPASPLQGVLPSCRVYVAPPDVWGCASGASAVCHKMPSTIALHVHHASLYTSERPTLYVIRMAPPGIKLLCIGRRDLIHSYRSWSLGLTHLCVRSCRHFMLWIP